jgi:hypothetical protein
MRILLAVSLLLLVAPVRAQAPDPISLAELLDAYKGQVQEAAGTAAARFEAMIATPEGKAYDRANRHLTDVQERLAKRILDRTGKVIDWRTGSLSEPPAPASGTQ